MDAQGRIKLITDTQTFGSNGFQKRELVITTEEQYPQHIIFEFVQDKCSLLDVYKPGQMVKVSFNLRGREWINPQGEAKYFNSLQGWRIENLETAQQNQSTQAPPSMPPAQPSDAFESTNDVNNDDFDDLPF